MPDLSAQHEIAITAVDAWIAETHHGSAKADLWRLQQHGFKKGAVGWTLPVTPDVSLLVVVDHRFPYSHPKTAVYGPGAPENAPHVEDDLRLCTLGTEARTDSTRPVAVVSAYIDKSIALLNDLSVGKHQEDFIVDFNAYWRRSSPHSPSVWTLGDLQGPSRPAFAVLRGQRSFIVSDDEDRLRAWLSNFSGTQFKGELLPSMIVWLAKLPVPERYPTNAGQVRVLIAEEAPEASAGVETLLTSSVGATCIVFAGASSANESGRGAFVLNRATSRAGRTTQLKPVKGFRPGRAPPGIVSLSTSVSRGQITAVDAANTRLPTSVRAISRDARVAIIGCGALGSGVARIFAQSGVRSLQLFDPDTVGWENIGRHELGAQDVGRNKATALAEFLQRRLPDVSVIGHASDWRDIIMDIGGWAEFDLVLSATADWGSDCALADLQAGGLIPCPVVYGWMERNAAASHAVALGIGSPSFRTRFDETGNAKLPATGWWEAELNPGCGAGTSAYGAVELAAAHSHVAGLALEIMLGAAQPPIWRVAIASTSLLQQAGGYWATAFKAIVGDPGVGARSYALKW